MVQGEPKREKQMSTTYKAQGYDLQRKSENKVYTYAVVFENIEWNHPSSPIGATFHISMKNAQKDATSIAKRSHLRVIEIVEATKVS